MELGASLRGGMDRCWMFLGTKKGRDLVVLKDRCKLRGSRRLSGEMVGVEVAVKRKTWHQLLIFLSAKGKLVRYTCGEIVRNERDLR